MVNSYEILDLRKKLDERFHLEKDEVDQVMNLIFELKRKRMMGEKKK